MILSNIIGLNPTGTMNFEGTYKLNGINNVVKDSNNASKENLKKTSNNEIVCNSVEHFENTNNKNYKLNKLNLFLIFILLFLIILFIKYFI